MTPGLDCMPTFEKIHETPDRETSIACLRELLEVLDEFPFKDAVSRSVALSMILTAMVRPSLPGAPIFGISATLMGSGKTYLAQVPPLLTMGRPAAVTAPPRDRKEEGKLTFAAAMGGAPYLLLDNYELRVESDTLCALATSETYSDRVLSLSKTLSVSTAFMLMITGNGLTASGDVTARMLNAHLDPETDHPEHRRFKRNLVEWIPANRHRLVSRTVSFLRGYIASGERHDREPWTRFPEWDRLIRGAILWADLPELPDPLLALRAGEKADPRRLEHEALMRHWHDAFGDKPEPVRKAIELANARAMTKADDAHGFQDALLDVAGERGEVNAKRLGHWLKKLAGRIQGGLRIVAGDHARGTATWAVEVVTASVECGL
jgi:putative DNA primase/helicase